MPQAFLAIFSLLVSSFAHASLFNHKLLINGAGATFPYPLYSKWFSEYEKLHPEIGFNYQSIGSGGGIRQLLDDTVDFGASDAPMKDDQLKKAKLPILHIPATMGAVVITFNLPHLEKEGAASQVKLDGALVADIFLGKIKKWNDPRILDMNPEIKPLLISNPDQDILVVHRSDGSGTTSIFSDFLKKSSPEWSKKVGAGKALRWPAGIGGKGNEGVSAFVKQIPGSIGYVELVFAKTLNLPFASILNPRGDFVVPSMDSVTAAAEGALSQIPKDFRTSITLVNAKNAYPISSFTYLLVYLRTPQQKKKLDSEARKRITHLDAFVAWALTEGQVLSPQLNYAPLPLALVKRVQKSLGITTGKGK